jgi:uncharacterized tellurite resistance protein B-like protein
MVLHHNFADFVLFLYIHMAYADGVFHPAEREMILGKMTKLFPNETVPTLNKKLGDAEKEYLSINSVDVPTVILDSFRNFIHVKFSQKYHVYSDMYDIVNADGKVVESETAALDELKRIIDLSAEAAT